jgi:hypothetical protein
MSLRHSAPAVLAGLMLVLSAQPAPAQKPFDDPVLERMRKDIFFLAGPECEGRGVETKGIEKAADYVVAAFKDAGLRPGMKDGSYFQPFTITAGVKLDKPTKLVLTGPKDDAKELKLGTDFNPMGFSPTSKASAGLVFVGYGVTAPKLKYDDYEGVDVAGKIVVMLRRIPRYAEKGEKRFDTTSPSADESEFAPFAAKIENAVAHKAAGIIMVNDTTAAGPRDPLPQFLNHAMGTEPAPFPVMFVKREVLDPLIASGPVRTVADIETLIDKDMKPRSFEIKGWKADAEVTVVKTEYKCKNIVGVLDGHGPLADETVVVGAHYDHIGYGTFGSLGGAAGNGKLHYGADDNASGTTGLIELARRFGAMKDRQGRRLVFIAFSAEERGLFGSQFYCKHPLFPLDATAAMINMDMIGRTKPVPTDWLGVGEKKDRLIVYGTGTGDGFEKLVDAGNTKTGDFRLTKLAAGSGPSDHDSFYRKKVPVLFLYTGTHGEYHRPTDVPEKINVPGMKKVADLVEYLAAELATRERPKYFATKDPWSDPTETRSARPAGPKLSVLPDYNYEGEGMRLEGVNAGGPGDKGGLKEGDVIVEIGGKPVKNVGGYMTAMSGTKAGTPTDIVVLRKEKRVTLKVTPE